MIRLSAFSDEACQSLSGQIEALRAAGIGMTELRSVDGVNVKDMSPDAARQYAAQLAEANIRVSAIGSPLGKVSIHTDMVAYEAVVRHVCELAQIFKTGRVRVFSFYEAYSAPEKVWVAMRRMVAIASEYDVTLYHENEKDIYADTAERVCELAEQVPGLHFVYDPANFLQVGESAEKTLRDVLPLCDHFHMKDLDISSGELVPVGHGSGRIGQLLAHLPEETIVTLEPHLALFEGYAAIDGTPMKHRFCFENGQQAFACAAQALHEELRKAGYTVQEEGYIK